MQFEYITQQMLRNENIEWNVSLWLWPLTLEQNQNWYKVSWTGCPADSAFNAPGTNNLTYTNQQVDHDRPIHLDHNHQTTYHWVLAIQIWMTKGVHAWCWNDYERIRWRRWSDLLPLLLFRSTLISLVWKRLWSSLTDARHRYPYRRYRKTSVDRIIKNWNQMSQKYR